MTNTNFFIVGKHPVLEALKNPQRKVLRLFLTEESKKNIHRVSPKKNLLKDVKVFFKTALIFVSWIEIYERRYYYKLFKPGD